jgi:hypothetical protein
MGHKQESPDGQQKQSGDHFGLRAIESVNFKAGPSVESPFTYFTHLRSPCTHPCSRVGAVKSDVRAVRGESKNELD